MKYDLNYKLNLSPTSSSGLGSISGKMDKLAQFNTISSIPSSSRSYDGVDIEKTRVEASNRLRMIDEIS